MMQDFWWLAVVSFSCAMNVLGHVLAFRIHTGAGMFKAMVVGFLIGIAAFLITSWILAPLPIWPQISNLLIYFCFSYIYFHWNNMGETARRIRLVRELGSAPEGLSRAEILARYDHHEIIDRRIGRLKEGGQIQEINSRYYARNSSILMIARMIALMKRVLALQ